MKVIKFGGTSVGEVWSIEQICYILSDKKKQKDRYAIIVSAISGITNNLVKCAQFAEKKNEKYQLLIDELEIKHLNMLKALFNNYDKKFLIKRIIKYINIIDIFYNSIYAIKYLSNKSLDKIMNFGELMSSYILNEKLKENGFFSFWKDSRELILLEKKYEDNQVNFKKSFLNIKYFFIKNNISYIILPGFIASNSNTDSATLGRGGSDYSASIFSAALQSEFLEIWTDVSGIMSAPPKIVFKSYSQEKISFIDVIELSKFGAKVLFPPTLIPSMSNNIPIIIKNTFSPLETGTFIYKLNEVKNLITGITGVYNLVFLIKEGNLKSFKYIINNNLYVFMIKSLNIFIKNLNNDFKEKEDLSIITIIVNDMKNIQITSQLMFKVFEQTRSEIHIIISSKINISTVLKKRFFKKSINMLHDIFFEKPLKKIHIFMLGLGNVGNKLIKQLHNQKDYLIEELHLHIRIIAICNSKKMFFNIQGINIKYWKKYIKLGTFFSIKEFTHKLYNINLYRSLCIDNTDSKEISNLYIDFLLKKIGIITCNKIACASSYLEYRKIKTIASYIRAPFFFETNVGAGLPVINTINYLIQSGDKIYFIYAVLSGSLNFILKQEKGYFLDSIREAQKKKITEPDSRIDLSGIDILRKILILIRESGSVIELEDIKQISFLPKICIKSSTEYNFYQEIIFNEDFFLQQRIVAKEQRKRIIYMTKHEHGITYLIIKNIGYKHPFYTLDSKDNMVIYATKRYIHQPLLIKGAGAGAEITASRVFSDIIKASI